MSMPFSARWDVSGVVMEKRELTSAKNATWRGYVAKVASLGHTFEINVTAEQFSVLVVGDVVSAVGHFEEQSGRLKLIMEKYQKVKSSPAA